MLKSSPNGLYYKGKCSFGQISVKIRGFCHNARSSNGRTQDFGSWYWGSNPCRAAILRQGYGVAGYELLLHLAKRQITHLLFWFD